MKYIIILFVFLTTIVKSQTTTYTLNTISDFSDFTIGGTPNNGTSVIQSSNFAPLSFTLGNNCNKTLVSPYYTAPSTMDSIVVTFSTVATTSITLEMLPSFPFPTYLPKNTTARLVYQNTSSVSIQTLNINSTHPIPNGYISIMDLKVIGYKTYNCPTPITYSVQTTPETCTGCCDGTAQVINLSGGCPAYTYVWQPGALVTSSVSSICFGIYTVTVSDAGCCPSVSQTFTVQSSSTTSLIENNLDNNLSIFPNPTNSILNIIDQKNQFQNATIEIKNYLGQVVLTTVYSNQIDITSLSSGMYFLAIKNSSNKKMVKILKQ